MSLSDRRNFLMGLMIPVAMVSCQSQSAPEKVAHTFIESYYVNMSLEGAKKVSMGLAKEKLENQLKLLDGQSITPGTNVPKVRARLISTEPGTGDEMSYIFEVKPDSPDVGPRKVYVKVRQEGGQWLVSQFTESDQG